MKNKRLLAVLIVFAVLGTVAIFGSIVFSIDDIEVEIRNELDFFAPEGATQQQRDAAAVRLQNEIRGALHFMIGRNILFNMDETQIRNTIENDVMNGHRINITNVRAVFPNRIHITIRERYEVYQIDNKVLDGDLRILGVGNLRDRDRVDIKPVFNGMEFTSLEVGSFLHSSDPDFELRARVVRRLQPFFAELESMEDAIAGNFVSMEFVYRFVDSAGTEILTTAPTLRMVQRLPVGGSPFTLYVVNADYRTEDKLQMFWDAFAALRIDFPTITGSFSVVERAGTPRGLVVFYEHNL